MLRRILKENYKLKIVNRIWTQRERIIIPCLCLLFIITPGIASAELAWWENGLLTTLNAIVVSVFGLFLSPAALAFNYSISEYVLQFGDIYINSNLGVAIDGVWGTVRDIFNLTFIFGLVWIGFQIILGINESNAKRTIVTLIGAALLVNFSLFITKFVVDFSNIAAYQIAAAFSNPEAIADAFTGVVGLSSIYGEGSGPVFDNMTLGGGFAYLFGSMVFLLVLTFVLFAGAILIIIRFVVLNIYMVLSPFMFLGWVFPSLAGTSKKYWSGFLGRAFFAPAFLFMLYLSYSILITFTGQTNLNIGQFTSGNPADLEAVIVYFILMIVFLVASLIVAQKMGAQGATTAINLGQRMQKGITGGMTSYAGRSTIGRFANWAGEKNDQLEGTRSGRTFKKLVTAASLGTFDERTRQSVIKAGKNAKFGGSYSYEDDETFAKTQKNTRTREENARERKASIKAGTEAQKTAAENRTTEQKDIIYKMQSAVADLTLSDLEAMSDKEREAIADSLTSSQTDSLMKSDKLTSKNKKEIGVKRAKAIEELVTKNQEIISDSLIKLTTEQIEDAGADFIKKYAGLFTTDQVDNIKKSKKFSPSQKAIFTESRNEFQKSAITESVGAGAAFTLFNTYTGKTDPKDAYKRRKSADVAGFGRDVLLHPNAINQLTVGDLEAIGDKRTLEKSDRDTLRKNIDNAAKSGNGNAKILKAWLDTPQAGRLNW